MEFFFYFSSQLFGKISVVFILEYFLSNSSRNPKGLFK
jgi:hypothetical protein